MAPAQEGHHQLGDAAVASLVDDEGRDLNDPETPEHRPGRPPNIWALHRFAPEATNAAYRGLPRAIIWHFVLSRNQRRGGC